MKANEAPKKIYLTTFGFPLCEPIPQDSSNPDTVWSEKPYTGADSIEYARTDYAEKVFIIKAQKWLAEIHRVCDITDENGYRIDLRELQARFEQYMKGE